MKCGLDFGEKLTSISVLICSIETLQPAIDDDVVMIKSKAVAKEGGGRLRRYSTVQLAF
jgi:hypothetical protein